MKAFLAVCLSLIVGAAQAQQLEFKGVPFGATKAEFQAAQPEFNCIASTMCFARGSAMQYAGIPANITAEFSDGKFTGLTVDFNPSFVGIIVEALASKYGDPTTVTASEFRTRGGATATNDEREWRLPDGGTILTERYGGSINEGRATLLSADGVRARAARFEEFKRQAKKNI